ncbi:MAG: DedA family protein [Deltaproteobacteria bacterium]|nr:DedA family protein [Deltaproteobacteria bacterium]
MLHDVVNWIVLIVGHWGYTGIVVMMFLESSFFPFPSEVVIPPAGYLAARGDMSLILVVLAGIAGSIFGALFNYGLAVLWGRPFFLKYGRYVLVSEQSLNRADRFFADHGHISTFVGRLLPGIRQYISLPAGISRMNLPLFTIFTGLGAGIWVVILALVGYFIGNNQEMVDQYLHQIVLATIGFAVFLVAVYILYRRQQRSRKV